MNLSLQQALKYGVKEDLIASAVHSGKKDPITLLVAADAHEEAGEEGTADLLRAAAKGQEGEDPVFQRSGLHGPAYGEYAKQGKVYASFSALADSPSAPVSAIHMHLILSGKDHQTQRWNTVLSPQEAREATARLPHSAVYHQFIDQHFPATNDQTESGRSS